MASDIFDKREKAFEEKYAKGEEAHFKTEARTLRKFALWSAGLLGHDKNKGEQYVDLLIERHLRGRALPQLIEDVRKDLAAKGVIFTTRQLENRLRSGIK